MLDGLISTLRRLRGRLAGKAEEAYEKRDSAESDSREESYAAGEAHAYGVAADEVRKEQQD